MIRIVVSFEGTQIKGNDREEVEYSTMPAAETESGMQSTAAKLSS